MSIEGGEFKCVAHDFITTSLDEWDEHCYKKKHTLSVEQICPNCNTKNYDKEYPYPKGFVRNAHTVGSGIVLQCKTCFKGDVQ